MDLVQKFAPHLPLLRRYARALTGSQDSGDAYIRASLAQLEKDTDVSGAAADRRLQALAPIQRQAFLLTALEGFSVKDAAYILGVSVEEHGELVNAAHRDIEQDLKTKVLIIEDEPIIAADLESLVGDLGHEVTGNATTRSEAVDMARAAHRRAA